MVPGDDDTGVRGFSSSFLGLAHNTVVSCTRGFMLIISLVLLVWNHDFDFYRCPPFNESFDVRITHAALNNYDAISDFVFFGLHDIELS